jgi:hypothetical protein
MPEDGSPPAPQAAAAKANPAVEKLERDVLRLLETLQEMERAGEKQTLRAIAERSGLSKDEVNRYLNPQVNEVYNLDRLLGVRGRNRPLYNHLIVSGPPHVVEERWAGINANTSKYVLFRAVAHRFGYEVRFLGAAGQIVDVEYRGIEATSTERLGKVYATQEPVMHL